MKNDRKQGGERGMTCSKGPGRWGLSTWWAQVSYQGTQNNVKDTVIIAALVTTELKYIHDREDVCCHREVLMYTFFLQLSNWVSTSEDTELISQCPQQKLLLTPHMNSLVDLHSFRTDWLMYTTHCQLSVVWWVLENALTYKPGGISQRGSM